MFKHKSNLIVKYSLTLIILLVTIVWIVQDNVNVQIYAKKKLIEILQKEWSSKITIDQSNLNLFTGTIILKKGCVCPFKNNNSLWSFEKAHVKFSRLHYFFSNELVLKIVFDDINVKTILKDNQLKIIDHLNNVLAPSNKFIIDLRSVKIHNLKLNFSDKQNNYIFNFIGKFYFKKIQLDLTQNLFWHGSANINNGSVFFNKQLIISNIKGNNYFYQQEGEESLWGIKINNQLEYLPSSCSSKKLCFSGKWGFFKRLFKITDTNNLLDLKISSSDHGLIRIDGFIDADLILQSYKFFNNKALNTKILGKLNLDTSFSFTKDCELFGNIKSKKLSINNKLLASGIIKFHIKNKELKFNVFTNLKFINSYKSFLLNGDGIYKNGCTKGKYLWEIKNKHKKIQNHFDGNYFVNKNEFNISGKHGWGRYIFSGLISPKLYITKVIYQTGGERLVDTIFDENKKKLKGKIKYSFLKSLLPINLKRNILGRNGNLFFELSREKHSCFNGFINLSGGKISWLGNYNPFKNAKCHFNFDYLTKELMLEDIKIGFFKGNFNSSKALLHFDNDFSIKYTYIPIKVENFLINYKQDFYAILDGNLSINKNSSFEISKDSLFKINGDLVLKRSLFKENDFSTEPEMFFAFPNPVVNKDNLFEINLNIYNKNPMKIKTSFVNANANLNLNFYSLYCDNQFITPKISGDIHLHNGILKFLKHKLYIYEGKVQFTSNEFNEPIIDLTAQNKIKKYLINLQATGLLGSPKVVLESSPNLSEEQILALLISGSENATLQTDLPNIFMSNLNNLIMGNKNVFPKGAEIFKKITLPFKYIQITPDFTNHFGGIKGTVSINLNNQIHTKIQKTFNMHEDFTFHVEYLLTDDINFKFVRDHRGEIGSELEVRFKL